jgi:adenylate cyclase
MQEAFNAMKKSLQSFARYVPITLVKHLIASGDVAHVGGENRLVTFLFSDISGFTSLSEHMDPTNLMNYLSEYFKSMSKIILQNQGTIDKYIGDAIMAFWNAPLEDAKHASKACTSALEMLAALTTLNVHWKAQGAPELTIRIGINTGNAVIGNVGSEDHLSYSAIGDSVNLTNRVEELNKVYKTKIIVSNHTYELVKNAFTFRLLDNVAVRGREEGVLIYELLPPNNIFGEHFNEYVSQFNIAFNHYQQQRWNEALSIFNKLASTYPQDKVASVFIERCAHLRQNPPLIWSGVWRFQ